MNESLWGEHERTAWVLPNEDDNLLWRNLVLPGHTHFRKGGKGSGGIALQPAVPLHCRVRPNHRAAFVHMTADGSCGLVNCEVGRGCVYSKPRRVEVMSWSTTEIKSAIAIRTQFFTHYSIQIHIPC